MRMRLQKKRIKINCKRGILCLRGWAIDETNYKIAVLSFYRNNTQIVVVCDCFHIFVTTQSIHDFIHLNIIFIYLGYVVYFIRTYRSDRSSATTSIF